MRCFSTLVSQSVILTLKTGYYPSHRQSQLIAANMARVFEFSEQVTRLLERALDGSHTAWNAFEGAVTPAEYRCSLVEFMGWWGHEYDSNDGTPWKQVPYFVVNLNSGKSCVFLSRYK